MNRPPHHYPNCSIHGYYNPQKWDRCPRCSDAEIAARDSSQEFVDWMNLEISRIAAVVPQVHEGYTVHDAISAALEEVFRLRATVGRLVEAAPVAGSRPYP